MGPIIIVILVTAASCLDIASTKISTTRDSLRTSLCNFYNANFTDADRQHSLKLIASYNYLTDNQIESMLYKQDFSQPAIQTFLMVAPHAACLVVLIIMVPGLICCCARPEKYPVCKMCRKPEAELYTKT